MMPTYPRTPDGRYFIVKGRLWRCTNPALDKKTRQRLVHALMSARRAVRTALSNHDFAALRKARSEVNRVKIALGERGPTWWDDDQDYNQRMIANTPYARWWEDRLGS